MAEGLREVTHGLTTDGDFFREDAQVVGKGEHIIEVGNGHLADIRTVDIAGELFHEARSLSRSEM